MLKTDHIDTDVVVVIDDVLGNAKTADIAIHNQRLTTARFQMVHSIPINYEVANGCFGVRPVNSNA